MDANFAAQVQDIALGDNAYLEYLPDAVIPYRNARFITRTRVRLPLSATLPLAPQRSATHCLCLGGVGKFD